MVVQKFEHIFGFLDMSPCTFLNASCAVPEELSFSDHLVLLRHLSIF